jgi:hypothetical protein
MDDNEGVVKDDILDFALAARGRVTGRLVDKFIDEYVPYTLRPCGK